jgi:hypothetical protein
MRTSKLRDSHSGKVARCQAVQCCRRLPVTPGLKQYSKTSADFAPTSEIESDFEPRIACITGLLCLERRGAAYLQERLGQTCQLKSIRAIEGKQRYSPVSEAALIALRFRVSSSCNGFGAITVETRISLVNAYAFDLLSPRQFG